MVQVLNLHVSVAMRFQTFVYLQFSFIVLSTIRGSTLTLPGPRGTHPNSGTGVNHIQF